MKNILCSLDLKFERIVVMIEEIKDLETFIINQILGSLQPYEEKQKKSRGLLNNTSRWNSRKQEKFQAIKETNVVEEDAEPRMRQRSWLWMRLELKN